MKKLVVPVIALSCLLGGCVDQGVANEKMARGCTAGINAVLKDGKKITDVTKITPTTEDFQGEGLHRRIILTVMEKDGWVELEKQYSCVFLEEWGPLRSSHSALLMQIDIDGDVYGKNNGDIVGDWDDFLAITRVVDAAMGQ